MHVCLMKEMPVMKAEQCPQAHGELILALGRHEK